MNCVSCSVRTPPRYRWIMLPLSSCVICEAGVPEWCARFRLAAEGEAAAADEPAAAAEAAPVAGASMTTLTTASLMGLAFNILMNFSQ